MPTQEEINARFESIKGLMEQGYKRYEACKKIGITRDYLYKHLNFEQKRILDEIYFSFSGGSSETKWRVENGKQRY